MSLSRIPLPSIAYVLTSDRALIPSRPCVIKFEFDPLKTIYPTPSGRGLMSDPIGVQPDQHNQVPAVEEKISFTLANDASTVGHSDHGQLHDGSDAQTVVAEKRPTISRGSIESKGLTGDVVLKGNFIALANTIRALFLRSNSTDLH